MKFAHPLQLIRNKFFKDTLVLQISGMITVTTSFVSSASIAFLLGAHGMGLFAVAVTLQAAFYSLAHVGVVSATVSQLAAASARELHEKVTLWLAFFVKVYLLFSSVMIAAGFFAMPALSRWWYGEDLGLEEAQRLGIWAWWLTWWILIDTPRAMAQVAFQSTRRMLGLAQMDNAFELMRMFLVILGACITGSPAGAVAGEIGGRVLGSFLALQMYADARKDGSAWLPTFGEVLSRVPRTPIREGLRLAMRVGVIKSATNMVVTVLPRLLLGGTAGFAWVAYFHVAQRIMVLPQMLMQGVSRTVLPALAEKRGKHDFAGFKRLYWKSTLLAGASISGATLLVTALVQPVVALTFPSDYAWPVFVCCAILTVGMIPSSFAIAQDPFYILTNRMKQNLAICLVGALVTVPANIYLVELDPERGAVWGQALYMAWVLVHFGYIALYFRRSAHSTEWEQGNAQPSSREPAPEPAK
ncbi:MAG: lipopolysaccharide biosynthesis protein [Planctomycetes bacterium]|nr:lipopolysaccharide biosynthesis protein [Planctomycetota bacterium]